MPRPRRSPGARAQDVTPPPVWTSFAAGAAALLPYLAWAPRAASAGDSSELTVVLATLGLAHPTGYPLYTLLGHVFVGALHALGARWEWAANAWSALGGAVAVGLWHALGARLLAREGVAPMRAAGVALLPAVAFGLNPAWTQETTVAEVTSWHLAWAGAATLFAAGTLAALPARRADPAWMARRVAAWSLLVGLGLTHHATSVLFAVPLSIALALAARPLKAAWLGPALAGAPLVALGFSYVLERSLHPAAAQWGALAPGIAPTWEHVTGGGYRHFLGGFAPSDEQRALIMTSVLPWLAPGLLLLLAWPFAGGPEPRPVRLALAAAGVLQTAYAFGYGVGDPSSYFLPALALGLFALPAVAATHAAVRRSARPLVMAAACALAVAAWLWAGAAREQRARDERLETFIRSMWNAIPLERGYVLWDADMCARLVQYQLLDHQKPGLVIVGPRLLADPVARELFARRHGFDPLAGTSPPTEEELSTHEGGRAFEMQVADGINRSTKDSVIVFLPAEPSLRLLDKPAPGPTSRSR